MPGKLRKLIKSKPPAFTPENDQSLKRRLSFLSKISSQQGTTTPASLASSAAPRVSPSPPTSHPTQATSERQPRPIQVPLPQRQPQYRGTSVAPYGPTSRILVPSQSVVTDRNQSGAPKRTPPTTGPSPAMIRRASSTENYPPPDPRESYGDPYRVERPTPSGVENQVPRSEVAGTGSRLRRLSRPTIANPPVIRTASQERLSPPQQPVANYPTSNPSFHIPQAQPRPQVSRSDIGQAPRPQVSRSDIGHVPPPQVSRSDVGHTLPPRISRSDVGHAPPPQMLRSDIGHASLTVPTNYPTERPHRHSDTHGRPIYMTSSQPGIPSGSTLNKSDSNIPPPEYTKNSRDSGISGVGSWWSRGSDLSSRVSSSLPSRNSRASSQILPPDRSRNSSQLGLPNEPGTRGSHVSFPTPSDSRPRRPSNSNFVGGFAPLRPAQPEPGPINVQPASRSNEDQRYPPPPEPRQAGHSRTSSLPSSAGPPQTGNPPIGSRTDHGHGHRRTRYQSTHSRHASSPSHSRQGSMFPFHDNRKPATPYANWHLLPYDKRPGWLVTETGHHGKVGAAEVQVPA